MDDKYTDDYWRQFRSKEEVMNDDKLAAAHDEHMQILHKCSVGCPNYSEESE